MNNKDKLIEKLKELVKMLSPHGAEFWGKESDKYFHLIKEIASLESQVEDEVLYEKEFVEWMYEYENLSLHSNKKYSFWLYGTLSWKTLDELYDYYIKNIKER